MNIKDLGCLFFINGISIFFLTLSGMNYKSFWYNLQQ